MYSYFFVQHVAVVFLLFMNDRQMEREGIGDRFIVGLLIHSFADFFYKALLVVKLNINKQFCSVFGFYSVAMQKKKKKKVLCMSSYKTTKC